MASRARNLANLLGGGSATIPVESIPEGVGGAAPVANDAALPTSGNSAGDLKFNQSKKTVHVWDGSEWDRLLSGADGSPVWQDSGAYLARPSTTALKSFDTMLSNDSAAIDFTVSAIDPEGFPITYAYDIFPSLPSQLTSVTQPSGNTIGRYLVTPNISDSSHNPGTFNLRLRASDGVRTISDVIQFNLEYGPANGFASLYTAATGGTIRYVTGGTDEANATDLTSLVENTVNSGDVVFLQKATGSNYGHFKYIGSGGTNHNIWANKAFAFVGGGLEPDNIFIWHDHDGNVGVRDHPIFAGSNSGATGTETYQQFAFNLTYHRHQGTGTQTNYTSTLTMQPANGGGTMLNCIIDLNVGSVAWTYDNSNSTAFIRSFKHCTFLNYGSWLAPYSGGNSVRVIDCAFQATYNGSGATFLGTQGTNIDLDGWTYDTYSNAGVDIKANDTNIANGTYGHMKDLNSVTASNTLFNNYQSAN
jgi:hypothetical protein